MIESITTKKAAEMLDVEEAYVRQLLKKGKLTGVKTLTSNKYRGEWRVNKKSVLEYLAQRRKAGRPKKL
jgi:excisionase family DNA binding protein